MCRGNQTEMACGHILTHITERCKKGEEKPCPEPESNGPRQHLADSCAKCDPEFQRSELAREQKCRHEELIAQLIADKRVNESKEARKLLDCMVQLNVTMNRKIGEVKTTGFSADVEFPGRGSHRMAPEITSKWVGGKCVWQGDKLERTGSSRIKTIVPTTAAIPEEPVEPLISNPPRLRNTKSEYFNRLPEESEQPPVSGSPRLRANKPYPGPRENVVVLDDELKAQQVLRPQPSLRRTRKFSNGLNIYNRSGEEPDAFVKSAGKQQDSRSSTPNSQLSGARTVVPIESRLNHMSGDGDSEDVWLQLADQSTDENVKGEGSLRSFRDRMMSA